MSPSKALVLSLIGSSVLSGCISTGDLVSKEAEKKNLAPFVEAYIEYAGAPSKWAGPSDFTLHVQAKDQAAPEFSIRHAMKALNAPADITAIKRSLASAGTPQASPSVSPSAVASPAVHAQAETSVVQYGLSLSTAAVREKLTQLAELVADNDENPEVAGCTSPLKVRLIRNDGSVLEKEGCRHPEGWPGWASRTVSAFIAARLDQVGGVPETAPAVHERVPASASPSKIHADVKTEISKHGDALPVKAPVKKQVKAESKAVKAAQVADHKTELKPSQKTTPGSDHKPAAHRLPAGE